MGKMNETFCPFRATSRVFQIPRATLRFALGCDIDAPFGALDANSLPQNLMWTEHKVDGTWNVPTTLSPLLSRYPFKRIDVTFSRFFHDEFGQVRGRAILVPGRGREIFSNKLLVE